MKTYEMSGFPPNSNPFHHDLFNMGTAIGRNFMIMYGSHNPTDRLIVVHIPSGRRFALNFEDLPVETKVTTIKRKEDN